MGGVRSDNNLFAGAGVVHGKRLYNLSRAEREGWTSHGDGDQAGAGEDQGRHTAGPFLGHLPRGGKPTVLFHAQIPTERSTAGIGKVAA